MYSRSWRTFSIVCRGDSRRRNRLASHPYTRPPDTLTRIVLAQPTHPVALAFIQQHETIGAKIFVFRDSRSVDGEKTHGVLLLPVACNTLTTPFRTMPSFNEPEGQFAYQRERPAAPS